ncbi:MAG: HAD-IA family hydrolase [Clostridia bacterium]|nr:HAD-IA family hydrolase [Clostridia bacterium]
MRDIKTVLFDLDGTLLPMDYDLFVKMYFGAMAKHLAPHGYVPDDVIGAIWSGTKAMVMNDGTCTNYDAFWDKFCSIYGEKAKKDMPLFDEFYEKYFVKAKDSCSFNPKAKEAVDFIKSKGFRVALATNPIFPSSATGQRISWAGLTTDDFELFTTYENSHFCKPNPAYYQEVCDRLGVKPEECLMVGNDADEDTAAEKIGMKVFLVTDCLLNKNGRDLSSYPQGSFDDLMNYIAELVK